MFDRINLNNCALAICYSIQGAVLLAMALLGLNTPSGIYDGVLYVFFIFATVLSFLVIKSWKIASVTRLIVEAIITFLLLSAVYKSTIYDNSPWLAQQAAVVVLILSALIKLFWNDLPAFVNQVNAGVKVLKPWSTAIVVVLMVLLMYMPDLEAVLAQILIGEQAHHLDFFLMSPGLSVLHGGKPYVDVISQYGVGVPMLLTKFSALFGGFDYLPVLRMVVFFGMAYFILFYFFTRAWLGSAIMAFAAFLVCFRLQMFHYGVSPLCWTYPSSTPIRFGLDLFWLWMLLKHLSDGRPLWLYLAAVYSGAAVYYMTSTGICVLVTFYVYLIALFCVSNLWKSDQRSWQQLTIATILPVIVATVLFLLTIGRPALTGVFWHNLLDYLTFFAHGHAGGVLPMHESLKYRNYWAAFMALIIPLFYLGTTIFLGILLWSKKIDRKYLLALIIAVYGLVNYQYFVVRSAMTSYYLSAVPFSLLCAFWVTVLLKQKTPIIAQGIRMACVAVAFYALLTNHNFISYPNLINLSPNPLVDLKVAQHFPDRQGYFNHQVKHIKEEDKVTLNAAGDQDERIMTEDSFKTDQELKEFVAKEYDFKNDAAMIASMTKPDERVAVVSSFETKLLIQAGRGPFFYHTPLVTSQPMRTRYFPSDAAHSPYFLRDTIAQLERDKPAIVFLESVYLQDNYPASYQESHRDILAIVQYIKERYQPFKRGQYITVMKRINI